MPRTRPPKSPPDAPAEPKAKKSKPGPSVVLNGSVIAAEPKKIGRPSTFTQEIADRVCEELRSGRTLRSVCEEDWAPSRDGLLGWADRMPAFADQYARAKTAGYEALGELTIDEASMYIKAEDVPAARMKLDARRWFLGKMAPKRYGDKVTQEVVGAGGGPVEIKPVALSPAEAIAYVRQLMAEAESILELPLDAAVGDDRTRLQRIVASDKPVPPRLYALISGGKPDDDGK